MYLKSIEVHGFKSFANKILFEFHNGITGIVGPNGSGKSNVADAVRWVLGEQSVKQLRGASMQDVIFSGTQNRKPLGYAYVAITLDNSDHSLAIDYPEVTVARRLYRSGESEYLINGSVCRLRDVNELFYDTGIGKEGYSIIGQGQIDKILSGKPEERRELFDEAAGIVKFKRRKNEAMKKLANEKQNLVRVNDILSELEKQVEPLEKQSEKAKIYLRKKEEMKTLDVNIFLVENKEIQEKLTKVSENYDISENALKESREKYEQIRGEYDRIAISIEKLEESIVQKRAELSNASEIRTKLEAQISIFEEQIKAQGENEEHFKQRENAIRAQIQEKEDEKSKILEEKKQFDDESAAKLSVIEEENKNLTMLQNQIENCHEEIETGKTTILNAVNDRGGIKARLSSFDARLEQVSIRKAELSSKLVHAKSEEAQQDEMIEKLEEEFQKINQEIKDIAAQQKEMEEKTAGFSKRLADKDSELRSAQTKYHEAKAKLESVSNIAERYEGYDNSVRKVMEQKSGNKGIVGVVADIIKTPKEYETAIEIALGGNIKNIVTEDEETAKKMIGFLKQNRFGRATFLPLTSIENPQKFKTPEVLEEKGVIGMACDLVKTDKAYQNVAKAMLGRIVVVDHIDQAVKIAKKYDYGVRMVTLEGELLVPGGAISGGAFKNNSNLLGRRRELTELEDRKQECLKQIEEIEKEITKIKEERTEHRQKMEELRKKQQETFIAQNTARLNVIAAQEKKNESGQGFEELMEQSKEIEQTMMEIESDKKKAQQDLENSQKQEEEITKKIEELQKLLDTLRQDEAEKAKKIARLKMDSEMVIQKQGFMQENVDRINGEIGRITGELDEILESLSMSKDDVELKQKEIESLKETIKASYTSQDEGKTKLDEDIARKQELSEKQKNFFSEREALSEQISALDKDVFKLGASKERLKEFLENQINYMWDEYEITLSQASELRNPDFNDLSAMKKQIGSLKDAIKRLGDVNVNAIEDYKALMERYSFLSNQQKDLVSAEEALIAIIDELDEAMRNQFHEKFEEISVEFDKVFKEMFGGGHGTLELMEDEDVLEAGIKIIAQPPGKKLQNMMQLSGGEKALTAIALLFAIQNLKPSPFCLLDEIEAALDDSNVGRFASYLHKLTKFTQFIVITHRRGTMERADRLYGITMQEKGVSTLVSVNLIENQLSK